MFNTKIFENTNNSASTPAMNIPNNDGSGNVNFSGGSANVNSSGNPQPIDITYQRQQSIFNNGRFRRESIAHSQGMGGVSWGSVTIGSWLKDEVMMSNNYNSYSNNHQHANFNNPIPASTNLNIAPTFNGNLINPRRGSFRNNNLQNISMSPPVHTSYLPDLEADYCKDYSCCGELLPTLHDLLRHYEEAHISPSPPTDNNHLLNNARNNNFSNMHNVMETVSTTDVFLNNGHNQFQNNQHSDPPQQINTNQIQNQPQQHVSNPNLNLHKNHYNIQQQTINQASPIPSHAPIPNQFNQNQNQHMQQNQNHPTSIPPHQTHHHPQQSQQQSPHINSPRSNTPMQTEDEDSMYIDDPARHLYVMENDEHKPYKCPVIGCEKTYKNQNGLKYHRLHGHQGQTLKENPDGTISIIDPESNTPYLDGAGMEKDKPYRCEVCGKRYKNLNGLKYHRGHTTH